MVQVVQHKQDYPGWFLSESSDPCMTGSLPVTLEPSTEKKPTGDIVPRRLHENERIEQ